MIKVLVVDDSGLMRLILSDIINSEKDMKVMDTAVDGKDATEKALRLCPDVILMDLTMGEYDGLYAVKNILSEKQIPIIILSAVGNTNMDPVLDALKMGAVDYLNKPEKNMARVRQISDEILTKIRVASKANKRLLNAKASVVKANSLAHTFEQHLSFDIIVIGSSTGGPSALEKIITRFPENIPIPVVIVQHMPADFVPPFVNRLDTITPLHVVLARKDDELLPGKIYIAPGSRNLIVRRREDGKVVFDYTHHRFKEYNHPSIDGLFLSVAEVYGERVISAVLTGMGRDGATGTGEIYNKGGFTIAQDKDTSVVYGMPREVADRGFAKAIVPIAEMAGFIVSCIA